MSILSLAEAKAAIPGLSIGDVALLLAIEDIEAEIVDRFGPYGAAGVSETIFPTTSTDRIVLRRKPAAIVSVAEYVSLTETMALDPTDYRLDGYVLERLRSGPNPRYAWSLYGLVVVYDPTDDTARRKMATIDVLKLETGFAGGKTSERIGDYSYNSGPSSGRTSENVTLDRTKILGRLRPKRIVAK